MLEGFLYIMEAGSAILPRFIPFLSLPAIPFFKFSNSTLKSE